MKVICVELVFVREAAAAQVIACREYQTAEHSTKPEPVEVEGQGGQQRCEGVRAIRRGEAGATVHVIENLVNVIVGVRHGCCSLLWPKGQR